MGINALQEDLQSLVFASNLAQPEMEKEVGRRRARSKERLLRKDSLEGPHEEAEIQRKALRRGKNLAFSENTCLEKKRVRLKVTPRKVGVGLNQRWEFSKRRLGWRLALMGIH